MRSIGLILCASVLGCGSVSSERTDAGDVPDAITGSIDAPPGAIDALVAIDSGGGPDAVPPPSLGAQQFVFFSDRDGVSGRDIWLMRLDGTGITQVTSGTEDDLFGSITPDGTRVVFARNSDIWAINVNGTGLTQLTTDTGLDTRPFLSLDGTKVAFTSNRGGSNNIYMMNIDGSSQTPVTTGSDSKSFGAFNHDGTKISYANSTDGNNYVINANGTGNMSLFPTTSSETTCAFSRDGTKVVFSSDRSGTWELYVGNSDGSGSPQVVTRSGNESPFHASFDYNGTHVVYYANLVGNSNRALFITPIAGGATIPLTNSANSDQKIGAWAILAP